MVRAKVQTHIVRSATYLLMASIISVAVSVAGTVCVKAQDMQKQGDESWTATRETTIPNTNPSRTTESHTRSGNRTVDRQRVEILGINGRYQPFSETETETVQVNATTTRTVVRRYQWDGNGRRILAQVTEEDSHTTASGDVRMESKTSNADLNGNFQVVRREVADTRKISPDVEETKSTVYQPDSYGGFAQAQPNSGGELTDHEIKQSNTTKPSDSPKRTARTKYVVKYASTGTQQPKVPPTRQKLEAPADEP